MININAQIHPSFINGSIANNQGKTILIFEMFIINIYFIFLFFFYGIFISFL